MLHRYIPREKVLQSSSPQFFHDPNFIDFRSWTALLSLQGVLPGENPAGPKALFLEEDAREYGIEQVPVKKPVCLRNPTRFTHLNVTIVCVQSGKKIFFAQELPSGRFLHLEFLQEGSYTLHYSPAFGQVTFHRNIRTCKSEPTTRFTRRNFHPDLKPSWQK
jgi:hypothetical protein